MEHWVSSKWLVLHFAFLVVLLMFRYAMSKNLKKNEKLGDSAASSYGWGILIALFLMSLATLGFGRYLEGTEEFVRYQTVLICVVFGLLLLFDVFSLVRYRKRWGFGFRTYSEFAVYDVLLILGNIGIWMLLATLKRN